MPCMYANKVWELLSSYLIALPTIYLQIAVQILRKAYILLDVAINFLSSGSSSVNLAKSRSLMVPEKENRQ